MNRAISRRSGRGQALAEFALVAPIFFLLVFSVIQIGLVFASQNGLVDAVRNAARRAATYRVNDGSFDLTIWPDICASIAAEVDAQMSRRVVGYNPANLTRAVSYEWVQTPDDDTSVDEYFLVAHVTATYRNPLYVPLISAFLDRADGTADDVLALTASEQMRVENPGLTFTSGSTPGSPPSSC
jgi:Flp pilus assembly protein TadG